jgi:iron complex transport system substrate-binding protein
VFFFDMKEVQMKKCILNFVPLLATISIVLLTSCTTPSSPPEKIIPPPPQETPEKPPEEIKLEPEELPSFPLTIVDDLGRKITIARLPQRIVSLAPSNTEIIFALGLDDKLVGTTDYCDYPEAAKTKTRIAGYTTPDIEKLVSLEPDLILAESVHEKMVLPALEKLGLTVVVTSATSLDMVLNDIKLIGQVNGKSKAAMQLVNDLKKRIDAVALKTSGLTPEQRPKVLYVVWYDPIWTMGSETFIDDLIWQAGGVNIFGTDFKKSRIVSLEAIITKNPQVIIVSGMGTTGDLIYNNVKRETRLSDVDALRNNRIYKISDANLIERPGPRIVDGLEEVARLLHPDIFGPLQ